MRIRTTTDAQLLHQYVNDQDEVAFRNLVERYTGLVLGVALRRTGQQEQAEEVTQNVFLILSRKARFLRRHPERLPGWLHRAAVLESRNSRRLECRRRVKMEAYQKAEHALSKERIGDVGQNDLRVLLDEAIDTLPSADRLVVLLRFFEGLPYKEIGEMQGKSEGACQKQITRALGKLSRFFQRKGVAISSTALASMLATELTRAAPAGIDGICAATVLKYANTPTLTQHIMHNYHPFLYSKTLIAICSSIIIAASAWVIVSQADEQPKETNSRTTTKQRATAPSPVAEHSADKVPVASQPSSIAMEPSQVIAKVKDLQTLLTLLMIFSNRHEGHFPPALDGLSPDYISAEDRYEYSSLRHNEENFRLSYVSGLAIGTLALDRPTSLKTPIFFLPVLVNGERIVGYWDGSVRMVAEKDFQRHLALTLKTYPKAKLITGDE